jgi:integrase
VANYAEALGAFCDWCVQRGYLSEDPLKALAPFDTTPRVQRRAMTAEEITRLLAACAPHRQLLLETAFLSGLRANELRNVTRNHLDLERGGLHLDATWTKNRKPGFQPLPADLAQRLHAFAESGEPLRLYRKFYRRRDAQLKAPTDPLLYVPSHTARDLDIDLAAAHIPKHAPGGKIDFHACRVAYINFVIESGASIKEVQTLARHSTPQLTMNIYGRVREERLSKAVEKVASSLQSNEERAICVQKQAVDAETKSATPLQNKELRSLQDGGAYVALFCFSETRVALAVLFFGSRNPVG